MGLNFKNKKLFYKKTLLLHFNTITHTKQTQPYGVYHTIPSVYHLIE